MNKYNGKKVFRKKREKKTYISICLYIYTYVYTSIYTYINTYTNTYIHTYIDAFEYLSEPNPRMINKVFIGTNERSDV